MHNREFTLERISKLKENEIAPLFANAVDVEKIILPKEFVDCNDTKTASEEEIPDVVLSLLGAGEPVSDDDIINKYISHNP